MEGKFGWNTERANVVIAVDFGSLMKIQA